MDMAVGIVLCPPDVILAVNNTKTSDCSNGDSAVKKCANCGQNHPASSIQCPKRQEYINIRDKIRNKNLVTRKNVQFQLDRNNFPSLNISTNNTNNFGNQPNLRNNTNNFENINPSYSEISEQNTNSANSPQNSNQTIYNSSDLLKIFDEMIEKLSNCTNKKDQIRILWEITSKYVYGN